MIIPSPALYWETESWGPSDSKSKAGVFSESISSRLKHNQKNPSECCQPEQNHKPSVLPGAAAAPWCSQFYSRAAGEAGLQLRMN